VGDFVFVRADFISGGVGFRVLTSGGQGEGLLLETEEKLFGGGAQLQSGITSLFCPDTRRLQRVLLEIIPDSTKDT